MRSVSIGLVAACSLALAACGADTVDTEGAKAVTPEGDIGELTPADGDLATLAVETLAEHLNVPISTITVDTVRAVDWRDTSIGCPQPGQSYGQVITPGNKITLRHDGTLYYVHEARGRAFVCVRQKAVRGVTQQLELEWGPMAYEARQDLAAKLGVEDNLVIIAAAEGTTWSDSSLACPEPGADYVAGNIDGYVITLRHGSRNYTYHTDLRRVIPCPPISED